MSTPEMENSITLPSEHSSHHESIGGDDNVQVLPSSDSQNLNESSTAGSNKKRKERSKVWDTFEKLKGGDGVNDKAECKNCKKKLSANSKNGTKHLLEHQIRCPARKTMDLKQSLLVANMAADGNMQLQNHNFDPELARLNLAYMIIMHEFAYVPCPHTAEVIVEVLFECLLDWNIDRKLSTLTLDNCTTNDSVATMLSLLVNRSLPTEHDWMLAREICERLEFFYVLIEMFSATSCPTANKIFIYICEIRLKIDEWHASEYVAIKLMAANMIEKFKKYWEDIHIIFSIALILDPRFKFRTIDYYFDKIYKDQAEFEKDKVRTVMHEIENEYKASFPKPNGGSGNNSSSSLVSNVHGSINIFEGIQSLEAYLSGSTIAQEKSEFDAYMEEPLLIPETLEALMCSQDWLWERLDVEGQSSRVANGVASYSSDEDEDDSVVTTLF
ncbi:hypothetical protein C2S52_017151 [Perilla frutescens var. hirtella]|nr:hypothetical protein C2S52_017151 [Perilla frutescens var. hirtella]